MSSFCGTGQLQFLGGPRRFYFCYGGKFPFFIRGTHVGGCSFACKRFLGVLFVHGGVFSLHNNGGGCTFLRESAVSPARLRISGVFVPGSFPRGNSRECGLCGSFRFPVQSSPFIHETVCSVTSVSKALLARKRVIDFREACYRPLSSVGLSSSRKGGLRRCLGFGSGVNLVRAPYSRGCLPSRGEGEQNHYLGGYFRGKRVCEAFRQSDTFSALSG